MNRSELSQKDIGRRVRWAIWQLDGTHDTGEGELVYYDNSTVTILGDDGSRIRCVYHRVEFVVQEMQLIELIPIQTYESDSNET